MPTTLANDVRDILFQSIISRRYAAEVTTERAGIVAGTGYAAARLAEIGITPWQMVAEGAPVSPGDLMIRFEGNPKQIALAEEQVIGAMAKFSGIATAARRAVTLGEGKCRIASGSWKKMPAEIRDAVRGAIELGGASTRLLHVPFLYLDKNYVRLFGGIGATLQAAAALKPERAIVIQLKGETGSIREETLEAVRGGADVVMIDTGKFDDAEAAIAVLEELKLRPEKQVAFGKDLGIDDVPRCVSIGVDLLCIGKEIVDAPLLDMRLDLVPGKD
jgi:nicotinate-nucleotide pyrophosphorylase (carboxylating)